MAGALQRFEQLIALHNNQCVPPLFASWRSFWKWSLLYGSISALITYYLGGWWYDLRVGLARGHRDPKASRFVNLYSAVLPSLLTIVACVGDTFRQPYPNAISYFDMQGMIVASILIVATFHSVAVSYCGARSMLKVPRTGACLWFLVLPIFFYVIVFAPFVVGFAEAALGIGYYRGRGSSLWLPPF